MNHKLHNPINKVLNLALYLALCFLLGTGLLMWLRIPAGQGRGKGGAGAELLGLGRHDWGNWHTNAALALVGLTLFHLVMNMPWLMKIAGGKHKWHLYSGLLAGAAIVLFFALYPLG